METITNSETLHSKKFTIKEGFEIDRIAETKRIVDLVPFANYTVGSSNLFIILKQCLGSKDDQKMLEIFKRLSKYETYPSQVPRRVKKASPAEPSVKRRTRALFYLQDPEGEKTFFYCKIRIDTSTIPGAGLGVFAEEKIPKGSKVLYVGKPVTGDYTETYSYEVLEYDEETGAIASLVSSDEEDGSEQSSESGSEESLSTSSEGEKKSEVMFYIDSSNEKTSNWTRTINCKSKEGDNNFSSSQFMDQIILKAERDVQVGEELFLFYGAEYVTSHLTGDN